MLKKNYEVFGTYRPVDNLSNIFHIKDRLILLQADLKEEKTILNAIQESDPDEFYNLASQSFVALSFKEAVETGDVTGLGVTRVLEAIKKYNSSIKFYQASSSEMFGKVNKSPQNENTPFNPQSPYAAAKIYGYHMTKNYREAYNMFACNGILFNHESERRGLRFVTKKITSSVAKISEGSENKLFLGNLEAKRDWGHASDYVEAMWLMLQQDKPTDYVIGTGETHSVKEFVEIAFNHVNLNYKDYVKIDQRFYRPTEVNILCADNSKAKKELGWEPKIKFHELIKMMVDYDLRLEKQGNHNI